MKGEDNKGKGLLSQIEWDSALASKLFLINIVLAVPILAIYWPLFSVAVLEAGQGILKHKIPKPRNYQLKWQLTLFSLALVIFHIFSNFDGQGKTDIFEAMTLNKPFKSLIKYEDMLIEETCWRDINKGSGTLPTKEDDQDQDHFPSPVCDKNDADPSSTPRKLLLSSSDPSPEKNDRILLSKEVTRFKVRAPHLGDNESIIKIYLYITSDDLTEEDGEHRYFVQECAPRYDHEDQWKIYCDLNEQIVPWGIYLHLITADNYTPLKGTRWLKWRMKYLTNTGEVGDVQYHWWNYLSPHWNYFQAISQ